jgi:hypothetical protein
MLTEPREAQPRTSTFYIDQAGQMDLTTIYEGPLGTVQTLAIYHVTGDQLTYNVAPPGRDRPTEFATKPGDGLTLVHLKRVQ